jgi:hypothetical protein
MAKLRKNLESNNEAEQASSIFDDALPIALQKDGEKELAEKKIKILTERSAKLSPFVIRLTREGQKPKDPALLAAEKLLEELKVQPTSQQEMLAVSLSDLADQIGNDELWGVDGESDELGEAESELVTFDSLASELINEISDGEEVVTEQESEPYIRISLPSISLPGNFRVRAVASFVALSLLVTGPLQAMNGIADLQNTAQILESSGAQAVQYLQNANGALQAQDFELAGKSFMSAEQTFTDLGDELRSALSGVTGIATLIPRTGRTIRSVESLIEAGGNLSRAAEAMTDAANTLNNAPHLSMTDKIAIFGTYANEIAPRLAKAEAEINKVDEGIIPIDRLETIQGLKRILPTLRGSFELYLENLGAIQTILGADTKRRYLLIFQNTAEIRATGGFAGSFAEIDIDRGKITAINVPAGGTYDLQGQLQTFVESPAPMHLIKPRWEFQDANWYPDFPLSAKQFINFHNSAGGPTVDGVIALNSTVLPRLLEITGPIELPEYGRTFTAENVLFELQKIVEIEYENLPPVQNRQEEAPKRVIGDLMSGVMSRLEDMEMSDSLAVFDLVLRQFNTKEAFVFFVDNEIQSRMHKLNWTGVQQKARLDELQVINTNIGGGKTDTVIDQEIDLLVDIKPDGTIVNTLTYTKRHRGLQTALFEGVNNVDYVRFYLPRGSRLISAEGFHEIPPPELFKVSDLPLGVDTTYNLVTKVLGKDEISGTDIFEENGKTVFGNWMQTKPGEIEQITLVYELPFRLSKGGNENSLIEQISRRIGLKDLHEYELLIQKQSGIANRNTRVMINHPQYRSIWESHGREVSLENDTDHLIQFLFER